MKYFLLISSLFILFSCQDYNSNSSDALKFKNVVVDDGGDPNFAAAKVVIDSRCVNCHTGEHNTWAGRTNEDWLNDPLAPITRGDPANSKLIIRTINTGGTPANMPLGGSALPDAEYTALKTWITEIP